MAPPPSPHARLPPTISGIDERCLIVDFTDLVLGAVTITSSFIAYDSRVRDGDAHPGTVGEKFRR